MNHKHILQQMVEINKSALDSTFNIMTLLQEQTERMLNLSLEQAAMLQKEGKRAFGEWLKACMKGNETFKKAVDNGFQKMEVFLA